MKSGTSFFNAAAFRKNITRFFPVWTIYLIGCIVVLLGIISDSQPSQALQDLEVIIAIMAVVNLGYAMLNAQLLFGDLFNSRLCNALHAMPMRREGWFLTNVTSGLCFGFVPYLVLALCFIPKLEWNWSATVVWMLAVDLQYLFFFALAVFCVFCTGKRFAAAMVYGLMNFLSLLAGWLIETVYIPLLNGVVFNWEPCRLFCPVVKLVENTEDYFFYYDRSYSHGISVGWNYLLVLGVLGLVLLIGSLLLYRKRKLEYAGDFLAVKRLEPVFRVIYTLTVGTVFHMFSDIFLDSDTNTVFLLVGLVIGYFTGQMLLQRTVRVFSGRTLIGFAVLAGVLLGSLGLTKLDPLGIGTWVPKTEQVAKVEICYDYYTHYIGSSAVLTEDEIPQGLELHRQMIRESDDSNRGKTDIQLVYTLKNGRTVYREYRVLVNSPLGRELNSLFSSWEHVLGYDDWEICLDRLEEVRVEDGLYTGEEARDLLKAVKADCDAGTMAQDWDFHDVDGTENITSYTWLVFTFDYQGDYPGIRELVIYDDAENTVNWLKSREDEWRYEYSEYKY